MARRFSSAATATEPDLLHSLLADLQHLRERAAGLVAKARNASAGETRPAWRALHREIFAAHARAEAFLQQATEEDGIDLPSLPASRPAPVAEEADASLIGSCRRSARELEEQCAAAAGLARTLGLVATAAALQRWRCELIGLERPMIAAHAEAESARR